MVYSNARPGALHDSRNVNVFCPEVNMDVLLVVKILKIIDLNVAFVQSKLGVGLELHRQEYILLSVFFVQREQEVAHLPEALEVLHLEALDVVQAEVEWVLVHTYVVFDQVQLVGGTVPGDVLISLGRAQLVDGCRGKHELST